MPQEAKSKAEVIAENVAVSTVRILQDHTTIMVSEEEWQRVFHILQSSALAAIEWYGREMQSRLTAESWN